MFFKSEDNGNSQPKWKWVVNVLEKKKTRAKNNNTQVENVKTHDMCVDAVNEMKRKKNAYRHFGALGLVLYAREREKKMAKHKKISLRKHEREKKRKEQGNNVKNKKTITNDSKNAH